MRKTFPKIYLILFSCRNLARFRIEVEVDEYKTKSVDPFVTNCEVAIDYLQSRVKMYK